MENISTLPSSLSPSPGSSLWHGHSFNYLHRRFTKAAPDSATFICYRSVFYSKSERLKCASLKAVKDPFRVRHPVQLDAHGLEAYSIAGGKNHKQLIILDLNGVLIRAYPRDQVVNVLEKPAMYLKHKKIYFRPELCYFIDRCLGSYEVAIWSCFAMSNIRYILKRSIGKKRMDKFLFIWDQKKCSFGGFISDSDGQQKPKLLKDIVKVSEYYPQYGPENTLMVDDSEYKLENNACWRYICPKSYDPEDHEADQSSIVLWEIINHCWYHHKTSTHLVNVR